MPEGPFDALGRHLLDSGVAPICVRRTIAELDDHMEDLRLEARASGLKGDAEIDYAMAKIGDQKELASQVLARPELKAWIYRYPQIARLCLPLAYVLLLPAAPIFIGVENASVVARWGTSLMVSAAVTGALFLAMQLAITLA